MVILFFILNLLYFGVGFYLFLKIFFEKILKTNEDLDTIVYISSFGFSYILVAWILEKIMLYIHVNDSYFYVSAILMLFAIPYILYIKKINVIKEAYKRLFLIFKADKILLFVVIITFMYYFVASLKPIIQNDPSQYFMLSSIIFENKDFNLYPFINYEMNQGFWTWTHPDGYIGMILWTFLLNDSAEYLLAAKSINIFYIILFILIIYRVLKVKTSNTIAILAIICFVTTPMIYSTAIVKHIDIIRLFTFFTTIVILSYIHKINNVKFYFLVSIYLGLSLQIHSINILLLIYIIPFVVFYNRKNIKLMILSAMIILGAIFFTLNRYVDSYQKFGYFIGDSTPSWKIEKLKFKEYLKVSRDLKSLENRLLNGLLKGYFHIYNFGLTFYLFTFALICYFFLIWRKSKLFYRIRILNNENLLFILSFYIIGGWGFVTFLTVFTNIDLFLKNDRYLLTIYPFIIYITFIMLFEISNKNNYLLVNK